jgi:hypothetical protein
LSASTPLHEPSTVAGDGAAGIERPVRVLFLTDDREDYLADGLLHGLRSTPWVEVVDEPRKHCLYAGGQRSRQCPELEVRGGGFNLYGTLSDDGEPERSQIFRKLERSWFDLVVLGNVWRQWGQLLDRSAVLGSLSSRSSSEAASAR